MLIPAALALLAAGGFAGAYLLWPRPLTAGEWVARRRAAEGIPLQRPQSGGGSAGMRPAARRAWLPRPPAFLRLPGEMSRDLALLRLTDTGLPTDEEALRRRLLTAAPVAAGAGLVVGLAVYLARGLAGFPALALLLPVAAGLLAPALLLRLVAGRARGVREAVDLNLPRVLTGARMLLESGAATPETALIRAAGLYDDPATAMLREAGRIRDVEFVAIDIALDRVAGVYGMPGLARLADAYRIAAQYGTGMAGVLASYAANLRQRTEADERSRITSAPIRMVPAAIVFFLFPFLVMILFLVFSPLAAVLGQL